MGNTYANSNNLLISLDIGDYPGLVIGTDSSELSGRRIDLVRYGAIKEGVTCLNNKRCNDRNVRFRFLAYRNSEFFVVCDPGEGLERFLSDAVFGQQFMQLTGTNAGRLCRLLYFALIFGQ